MVYYDELFHIFEYLDLCDIINVRLVSKQFNDILNDDFLWKTYYETSQYYHIKHSDLNMLSYKDAYKKCHKLNVLKHKLDMNESITDMMNLQQLLLNNTKIPSEISLLVNLKELYLNYTEIKEIPFEISQFVNLEKLYLRNNQIKEIQGIRVDWDLMRRRYIRKKFGFFLKKYLNFL